MGHWKKCPSGHLIFQHSTGPAVLPITYRFSTVALSEQPGCGQFVSSTTLLPPAHEDGGAGLEPATLVFLFYGAHPTLFQTKLPPPSSMVLAVSQA